MDVARGRIRGRGWDVDACVGAAQHIVEDLVHPLAGALVRHAQGAEHLEQLDLDPRRGHAVVVEGGGQPVLGDLLEDGDERGHEVLLR